MMNRANYTVASISACGLLLIGCDQATEQPPLVAPSIVLASLQSETLIPRRADLSCETFSGQTEQDSSAICISNSCGFGEAIFRVETLLVGSAPSNGALRYRLGEWCEPEFQLNRNVLLLAVDAYDAATGEHKFRFERSYQTQDGARYFVPESITEIDGLELRTLAKTLEEPLVYGDVLDTAPGEVERLLSIGFVKAVDGALVADSGVYVTDLVGALQKR